MINYYEVLEVSEKASKEVIEKAHKALAKKYHPDLNQDNLKEAIDCFKVYSNYTGTTYASQANDLIYESSEYQYERDLIVENNSDLFKQQNFII